VVVEVPVDVTATATVIVETTRGELHQMTQLGQQLHLPRSHAVGIEIYMGSIIYFFCIRFTVTINSLARMFLPISSPGITF